LSKHKEKLQAQVPTFYFFLFIVLPFFFYFFSTCLSGLAIDWYYSRPSRLNTFPVSIFFVENEKPFFDVLLLSGVLIHILSVSYSIKQSAPVMLKHHLYLKAFSRWVLIAVFMISGCTYMFFSKRMLVYNHNIQAYTLMRLNKLDKAENFLNKVFIYSPTDIKAKLNLITILIHKGEYHNARHYLQEVLEQEPDNENAHLQLGIISMNEKDFENAINLFQKVLEKNPHSLKAHENLGYLFYDQNKASEAFIHFHSVVELDATNPKGLYNLAITLSRLGQSDNSIELLSDALLINPLYVEAHDNLGVAFVNKGNIEKAVHHFQTALQIDPEYEPALNHFKGLTKRIFEFARYCETAHNFDKAISLYKKLSKFRPQWSGSLFYNISRIYSQKHDEKKSVHWLKKAVENNFCSWDILKADRHFETIRNHPYYLSLIRKIE
jgi:Tfp pilus assembly protein PilF